jgi:outer membrane protein
MNKKFVAALLSVAVVLGAFSTSAFAAREAGDWIARVGMTNLDPKQKAGEIYGTGTALDGAGITVDEDTAVSITGAYMFTPNLGLELQVSTPFEHDISVAGEQFGSTQLLPPTLNVQWHFNPAGQFHPYVGAGINYTLFFSQKFPIAGLELDDTVGYDLQVGVDFELSDNLLLNFDVRYFDLAPDLKRNGTKIATVALDPVTVGINLGWKF